MQGIPYRSKLLPHFERIRSERLMRKTWREISELLEQMHGIKASPSNVYEFFKRRLQNSGTPLGFPNEVGTSATDAENESRSTAPSKARAKQALQEDRKIRNAAKLSEKRGGEVMEEDRKLQEEARLLEEKARLVMEEDRKLQEEARLLEEKASQKMEEVRKLQEEARLSEERARLKMEEDRKLQEEARMLEEKAKLIMDEDRKHQEEARLADDIVRRKKDEARELLEASKLEEIKTEQILEVKTRVPKRTEQEIPSKVREWGNFDFQMAEQNENLPD